MPSLDQLATKIKPAPSSSMSPASAMRPRLAATLLRGSSSSIVTTSSATTAASGDSTAVNPPDSPTDTSGTGSADEANVVEKLDKLDLTDPQRKATRGYKNIPSLEAITIRLNDRRRKDSYGPGSLASTPDTERSKEDLLQVPPANAPKDQSASEKSKEHPLQNQWVLYYDTKAKFPTTATEPSTPFVPQSTDTGVYEAGLSVIGEFASVEAFCRYFNWLKPPSKLERNSNYHLFKKGIKPMWEDTANANGGRWVLTMRNNPQLLDRCWNWLVFALIGEDLDDGEEICGAVVSLRSKQDRIQLWIRSKDDVEKINSIGKKLIKTLEVSEADGIGFEFQYNTDDRPPPQKFLSIQAPYPQPRYHQHNGSIGNNAFSPVSDPNSPNYPSGQSFNNFTPPSSSGPGQSFAAPAFGPGAGMGAFGGWRGGPRRGGPPGGGPGHFQGPPPNAQAPPAAAAAPSKE
ncbi:translation initiation factor eIF4e [Exidia glandulosa HHB12029]|uniref:Translation initiation factor eIF4e n=1 Tax=Exidia glandulosa HHB12029 TaxID=1314781 RepID=A0A165BML9_EXIGL|nr:translation initiation factor eIF4e [Exidia glandulosa HHB12029]